MTIFIVIGVSCILNLIESHLIKEKKYESAKLFDKVVLIVLGIGALIEMIVKGW